ncbi:4-coumarate--CoA ligase 1-like [Bradysia coprophila]|uniref:4-coumarate--CoA ligase 1-like n=1 Tax=Bradysia coprophila TaxID=38358 RepID=UPI00187D7AE8|nr:4-coumarate--CoA ligase 1-like [Bradysia coprophila]XP_037030651.1 4-coumarate--CoA ligase 1-like [Bradysia coprophila]
MENKMSSDSHILYGGPDIPFMHSDAKCLGEMIQRQFNANGSKICFVNADSGQTMTVGELYVRSIQLAKALRLDGVDAGDVIGLCSENRAEFPVVLFAALFVGATVAPLNTSYIEDELIHALSLSKPSIVFATSFTIGKIVQAASKSSFISKVICLDDKQPNRAVTKYSKYVNVTKSSNEKFACKPVDINSNIALILCSSGTTGLPKGVQLTQANLWGAVSQLHDTFNLLKDVLDGGITILSIIPWFHAYGLLTTIGMAICGAKLVTFPRFNEKIFLKSIEAYKVNVLMAVPPLMLILAKHPLVSKYDLSSLLVIFCGAAPLSKEIEDEVYKRIGVLAIRQGFGMSEMTLSVLSQDQEHCSSGSVGCLRPGMYGKVIDPDTGKILGPNEHGELCFKGSAVMKGYIGNQQATQQTIDDDGWLHTGDIGYFDDNHEWFIVDRIKELIKYKGFQVPPADVEKVLLTHPDIMDAGVVGVPNEAAGELPMAFVVKKRNAKLTEKDVIDYVAEKMSHAKRLHGGVKFIKEIPKNMSGKILRRELRKLVTDGKSKL